MPTQSETRWFACFKANSQAVLRIFCFPYAGGGPLIFRTWAENLPLAVEVCPVQLPGRGSRLSEKPFTHLLPMVDAVEEALLPYLDKPFAFFGHSMGAMISFELARKLRREHGLRPAHIFVSGRRAPQLTEVRTPTYNLPEHEFVEKLRELKGTPGDVLGNREIMQLIMPLLRADFEVSQTYQYSPGPPLDCPISAFGGLQDQEVPRDVIEPWNDQTTASFVLRMLPGDHFFIHTAQHLITRLLTQELQQIVARIRG